MFPNGEILDLFNMRSIMIFITLAFPVVQDVQAVAANYPEVMIILDGSGSMWGEVDKVSKIVAAKEVLQKIVASLPKEVKTGLALFIGLERRVPVAHILENRAQG